MKEKIKIATIDLYNNEPNEGMRCIRDIVNEASNSNSQVKIQYDVFETRYKGITPDLNYNIFISSGGPGSPFEGEGTQWEKDYFNLLEKNLESQSKTMMRRNIFFSSVIHSK